MVRFPDSTKICVNGLTEILADLYAQGRQPDQGTAEEIIKRLEARNNYIPSSDRTRREFAYVLLKEYLDYVNSNNPKP
jgi:hypothetical protein